MLKRLQVFNNTPYDLIPYLTVMFQYYQKHGVTLNYDITQVNVIGYQSTYGAIGAGGNGWYLTGAPALLPQSDHDIVMFVFDLNEWKAPWWNPFPLRSDTPRSSCITVPNTVANSKPFINLGFYNKDLDGTQMVFQHEPMHALAKILNCPDQIDNYYKNNLAQYQDPDSSMSLQWSIFKPYIMPLQAPTSPQDASSTPNVILTRLNDNGVETLGTLTATNNGATFSCSTLELPYKDNQHDISCIPKGTYSVTMQPFHDKQRYELNPTAPRTGIFIHEGNYYHDSLGCILLGVKPSDINHDGQVDVTSSVNTVQAFMDFMHNQPFALTIL